MTATIDTAEADAVVIGAGPVGLFAVFALGQLGLKAVVVDALHEAGGQCAALYPDKPIYDIPSRTSVTGGELVESLLAQAQPYEPRYLLGRKVTAMSEGDGRFRLTLSDGMSVDAAAVVVAAGAGAFGPNRPPIEGLEAYEGRSVFYSVRAPQRFRNKRVVIAGGGDSAADWAVYLAEVASSVTLVHRRATFRAAPATVAAIQAHAAAGRIRMLTSRSLCGLTGADGQVAAVEVSDGDGRVEAVPADALLCFYGLAKDLTMLADWRIEASKADIPVDQATMATSRPGIYAIGDVASYPGKLKLILSGFAEAAAAAHAVRVHLRPNESFHFSYSTSRGRPGQEPVR